MHIAWICGARVLGGAERVTLVVANALRRRGHRVSPFCPADGPLRDALVQQGMEPRAAPIGARSLRACYALSRALGQTMPDVALVTTSSEFLTAMLAPRPTATRLVLARHMVQPLSRPLRRLIALRADAVIAVSEAVRASLTDGLPDGLLHVIRNPVRFPIRAAVPAAAERAQARAALGLTSAGSWVGFFGGVHESKGIHAALSTVHAANQAGLPVRLLVGGHADPRMPPLATLAAELGIANLVHQLADAERMRDALTACDVVMMATHTCLSEALPATLAEAMACGTPVLAYATGGMAELIGHDGEAGRLARPNDQGDLARLLREMLSDAPARAQLAHQGLQRIRSLCDPEHAVDRYEKLFECLGERTNTAEGAGAGAGGFGSR